MAGMTNPFVYDGTPLMAAAEIYQRSQQLALEAQRHDRELALAEADNRRKDQAHQADLSLKRAQFDALQDERRQKQAELDAQKAGIPAMADEIVRSQGLPTRTTGIGMSPEQIGDTVGQAAGGMMSMPFGGTSPMSNQGMQVSQAFGAPAPSGIPMAAGIGAGMGYAMGMPATVDQPTPQVEGYRAMLADPHARQAALSAVLANSTRRYGTDVNAGLGYANMNVRERQGDEKNAIDWAKLDLSKQLADWKTRIRVGGMGGKKAIEEARKAHDSLVSSRDKSEDNASKAVQNSERIMNDLRAQASIMGFRDPREHPDFARRQADAMAEYQRAGTLREQAGKLNGDIDRLREITVERATNAGRVKPKPGGDKKKAYKPGDNPAGL